MEENQTNKIVGCLWLCGVCWSLVKKIFLSFGGKPESQLIKNLQTLLENCGKKTKDFTLTLNSEIYIKKG